MGLLYSDLAPSSGRAGGQCPPYEIISFLDFNFRNKARVQDLSIDTQEDKLELTVEVLAACSELASCTIKATILSEPRVNLTGKVSSLS